MTEREIFELRALGYTAHDGGPRPASITALSQPGVRFEDGTAIPQGHVEAEKIDWSRVRGWKLRDKRFHSPGLAFGTRKRGK